jgi:hypothetical protein
LAAHAARDIDKDIGAAAVGDTGDSVAWISQVAMNGANPPKMATESAIELP